MQAEASANRHGTEKADSPVLPILRAPRLRGLLFRCSRLLSSFGYWVRRRFTKAGYAVLGGLLVTSVLGTDLEHSLAHQIYTFLLALVLVALATSLGFRGRFTARRVLPRFGTAGIPLNYLLSVENQTGRLESSLLVLENLVDPRSTQEEFIAQQMVEEKRFKSLRLSRRRSYRSPAMATIKEQALPPLAPRSEAEVRMELLPLKRGQVRFEGVTVARPDPLGLFKAFQVLSLPQSLLILPKRYPLPPIALPGTMKYQQGGVALAASVGESEEFVSLRDYRPGDPLRHIHWKSWARTGRPIVKEFQEEFFVRHALILDTFSDGEQEEVFEEAVSVAASFACTIQTQESLLDLMFVGPQAYCFTSGRGLAHSDQMLEILASVKVCRDKPFASLQRLVIEHLAGLSGCICIFLAWDQARRDFVEQLKVIGVPLLVLVITEAGQAKTLDAGPLKDQPGRFHALAAGKIAEGLAEL